MNRLEAWQWQTWWVNLRLASTRTASSIRPSSSSSPFLPPFSSPISVTFRLFSLAHGSGLPLLGTGEFTPCPSWSSWFRRPSTVCIYESQWLGLAVHACAFVCVCMCAFVCVCVHEWLYVMGVCSSFVCVCVCGMNA